MEELRPELFVRVPPHEVDTPVRTGASHPTSYATRAKFAVGQQWIPLALVLDFHNAFATCSQPAFVEAKERRQRGPIQFFNCGMGRTRAPHRVSSR